MQALTTCLKNIEILWNNLLGSVKLSLKGNKKKTMLFKAFIFLLEIKVVEESIRESEVLF